MTLVAGKRIAELLEEAARLADHGDAAEAGGLAIELAVNLTTLGTIRRRRGDDGEAARLHRRALAVLRSSVDPRHPLLRTIEDNLATAHPTRQRLKETLR
ncbi:MAG: hypothetical protein M3O23_05410 [Actinomycetota bacterium]|nr:hypothetical protein [Actinomycetota bacterium]